MYKFTSATRKVVSTLENSRLDRFQNRVAQHVQLVVLSPLLPVASSNFHQERSNG